MAKAAGSDTVHTTGSLASLLGAELVGPADVPIRGLNSLAHASGGEMTFIGDHKHAKAWPESKAAAAVVTVGVDVPGTTDTRRALLFVGNADRAMIRLLELFAPADERPGPLQGRHPSALIDPSAEVSSKATIGPGVTIGPRSTIAEDVMLFPGVTIYADVEIGAGSVLHANVVVRERSKIGRRVILHNGVSIGSDGFGYRPSDDGSRLLKVPHLGNVIIEDDVEIGANTCVDRGKFGPTVIGAGTKIDNLCQIAHNCRIGRGCVIAGQSGLSGSVTVGDGVQMGGGVTVLDHITIGDGAMIAGRSGIWRDVEPGAAMFGYPAEPHRDMLRQLASIHKLPRWMREVTRRLDRLEQ